MQLIANICFTIGTPLQCYFFESTRILNKHNVFEFPASTRTSPSGRHRSLGSTLRGEFLIHRRCQRERRKTAEKVRGEWDKKNDFLKRVFLLPRSSDRLYVLNRSIRFAFQRIPWLQKGLCGRGYSRIARSQWLLSVFSLRPDSLDEMMTTQKAEYEATRAINGLLVCFSAGRL